MSPRTCIAVTVLMLGCGSSAPTITQRVYVADARRGSVVLAVERGGLRTELGDEYMLKADGVVEQDRQPVMTLEPTDIVEVSGRARPGDVTIDGQRVVRDRDIGMVVGGIVVLGGGAPASIAGGVACAVHASGGNGWGCLAFGFGGVAASATFGALMIASGARGTMRLERSPTHASAGPIPGGAAGNVIISF